MFTKWTTMLLGLVLISAVDDADILNEAFCRKNYTKTSDFPLAVPKPFSTPWVWDAVYNNRKLAVEITIIPRKACYFDRIIWHEAVQSFPQYSHFLANGLIENILVETENLTSVYGEKQRRALQGEALNCIYYKHSSIAPIAVTKSEKIQGELTWLLHGTALIVCPAPNAEFDEMRISKGRMSDYKSTRNSSDALMTFVDSSMSDTFPVCRLADLTKNIVNIKHDKKGRFYGISVCTATDRTNREELVEWLEYHKLIGVDHFYIYSTAKPGLQSAIYSVLADYIEEGSVTVVSWRYKNCVKGMASGRFTAWYNYTQSTQYIFSPPKAIAQSAALASCYSRFKQFTKYMMHIDDDEFVAMNSSVTGNQANQIWIPSQLGAKQKFHRPLYAYANRKFRTNPSALALSFSPVGKYYCPSLDNLNDKVNERTLPRVGTWLVSKLGSTFEGKLLMKTSAVRMFHIHYLSQLESNNKSYKPLSISTNEVALLHYKKSPEVTGEIWGIHYLESYKARLEPKMCYKSPVDGVLKENEQERFYNASMNRYIQTIDHNSRVLLNRNYQDRVRI